MDTLILVTLAMGIALGAICLLAAVYNYIKHQSFGTGGIFLVVFGTILLGFSIWQSVEVTIDPDGGFTGKFKYKQDLVAEGAERNIQFEKLKKKLTEMHEDLDLLKCNTNGAVIPQAKLAQRKQSEQAFDQNSKYSVLVFNKPAQSAVAENITKALLSNGYKSSSIATDLSESKHQYSSDTARLLYTKKGQTILVKIKAMIAGNTQNLNIVEEKNPIELMRGDIQVLLY